MATTRTPETGSDSGAGGLAARISLGKVFKPKPVEFIIIASTAVFLTGFGLVMVLSATSAAGGDSPYDTFSKQLLFAVVGIPLMFVMSRFPIAFWKRIAWLVLILAVGLQLLVFSPLGQGEQDGNSNWIEIGGFQAQPSEFLKLSLAVWIGFILAKKENLLKNWTHLAIPLVPVVILVIGTVLAGSDMGTSMILAGIVFAALFFAGVKLRYLLLPALAAIAAAVALVLSRPDRLLRFTSFLDETCDVENRYCYQPLHAMYALAGGGVFGRGLGNSVEKYGWLPAQGNDFIFAIVGEELGLIGAIVVLILFGMLAYAGISVARRTDDLFVRIVSGAITVWIVGQALVNIAVVLRLAPPLGVPLPFLSQGGTALISVLMACGVLLSCAASLPVKGERAPAGVRHRNPVQQID